MCENVYCSCKHIKLLICLYKVFFYLFLELQFRLEVTSYSAKNIKKKRKHTVQNHSTVHNLLYVMAAQTALLTPGRGCSPYQVLNTHPFWPTCFLEQSIHFNTQLQLTKFPLMEELIHTVMQRVVREPFWWRNWKARDLYYYQWTMHQYTTQKSW